MKKLYSVVPACLLSMSLIGMLPSYAAQPTNINYSGKGSDYRLYTVRCSDGKRRMLTSWLDKEDDKWCVGKEGRSNCSNSQLKAAKIACQ